MASTADIRAWTRSVEDVYDTTIMLQLEEALNCMSPADIANLSRERIMDLAWGIHCMVYNLFQNPDTGIGDNPTPDMEVVYSGTSDREVIAREPPKEFDPGQARRSARLHVE